MWKLTNMLIDPAKMLAKSLYRNVTVNKPAKYQTKNSKNTWKIYQYQYTLEIFGCDCTFTRREVHSILRVFRPIFRVIPFCSCSHIDLSSNTIALHLLRTFSMIGSVSGDQKKKGWIRRHSYKFRPFQRNPEEEHCWMKALWFFL